MVKFVILNKFLYFTWNIPGPLHSTEEQPGGELTDVVDADHVLVLEVRVAGSRVGLCPH